MRQFDYVREATRMWVGGGGEGSKKIAFEQRFETKEYIYDDTKRDFREKFGQKCEFD